MHLTHSMCINTTDTFPLSCHAGVTFVGKLTRQYDEYKNYFARLNPSNNTRNPWFQEYWMKKFNCSLPGTTTQGQTPCTGKSVTGQFLANDDNEYYEQDEKVKFCPTVQTLKNGQLLSETNFVSAIINHLLQNLLQLIHQPCE